MFDMRVQYLTILLGSLLICTPLGGHAQEMSIPENMPPEQLEDMAQEAFDSGSVGDQAWAFQLWTRAAKLYAEEEEFLRAAEAWDNAGRAHLALEETEQALAAFGVAISLRHKASENADSQLAMADFAQLANRSPVLTPSMGMEEEARYVNEVREIIAGTPAGEEVASEINSAGEATIVLESLMSSSFTQMKIWADTLGVPVYFRRWAYKDNDNAPWNQVYADTTVSVSRAAYQIRYRVPGTARDTTIVVPCANGCMQRVISRH